MLSGFRKFLLQGNLITTAVAFIMATTFAAVVAAFVKIILDLAGKAGGTSAFSGYAPGGVHVGLFITAVITFVVVAAVVYFAVVVPYTHAKERFFPDPEPGQTELDVLNEIRDLLAQQRPNP